MNRQVVIAVGIVLALAGAAALDLVVNGSLSIVPLGALVAAVGLVVGSKALGAHVLSRPAGSRPGELGDPADDLVDDVLDDLFDESVDGSEEGSDA